jgi:hypothetical protein
MKVKPNKKYVFFGNKDLVKMEINVIFYMSMTKKNCPYADFIKSLEHATKVIFVYIDIFFLNRNKMFNS